ncbi:MAG: trypsin-like peptidase domain-containing protein [Gammaproteobacteria bacterium]
MNRISCLMLLAVGCSVATAQEARWDRTIERISSGVVSIRVDSTRSFDTERNQSSQATGFVVDAERGLILTNRHVVTPGPVRAQAIFNNQEEVDLVPVYRDPVHDFGFFRYAPQDLQFIQPAELPLIDGVPQIGREIRVIGNDAGEQLSILAGTIARLDRQAPNYGRGNYNDFNTFYYQAASGTSGGSSGSPVVDIDGQVVALNAGSNTRAASSFFLPLDRIRVALEHIRNDRAVPRGTLQTEFIFRPYAQLRRLGLTRDTEATMRAANPDQTGLLVVEQVIPGSQAADLLRPGDVLVTVNGELVASFSALAGQLDDSVGQGVRIGIERGGESIEHTIVVDDLDAITPDEYLEYGDGIFHDLSYQQARHYYRPVEGVFVANPGYVFGTGAIPRGSLITAIEGRPVEDLDDLQALLVNVPEGDQVSVRFVPFDDPGSERQRFITNNRDWFPAARCRKDDKLGVWPCEALPPAAPRSPRAPQTISFPDVGERHARAIAPSLVLVNFSMPYTISGVSDRYYYGTGLVVDAERGWVVVDRNTVPVALGDVRLTFAGSIEIPGSVEFVHPLHNLAVVSYDPQLLGDTQVRSATFVDSQFESGDDVYVVGLSPDHSLRSQSSEIDRVTQTSFPISSTLRFRESNIDVVELVNGPDDFDGVVVDRQGAVLAVWASFAVQSGRDLTQVNLGMPGAIVSDMIEIMRSGHRLRSLEVEWQKMPLATARKLDLPDEWGRRYEAYDSVRREMLSVAGLVAGSPAQALLRTGDVLLAIDGEPTNQFRDVELAMQRESVALTILRDGEELTFDVPTVELNGFGVDRIVLWGGALLQMPHRALAAQRGIGPGGVYVAFFNFGSPASRSELFAGRRIVAVDGQPTPDLDAFVDVVSGIEKDASIRIDTVSWNNVPQVITLKPDEQYWPSYQLVRNGSSWTRLPLE